MPFIGMEHVAPNSLRPTGQGEFRAMKSAAAHFSPGDVLYGRMRPYLNKVFRAEFEGAASAEFIVFPTTESIDSDFLKYLLHHGAFVSYATHATSGDRPRIDYDQIAPYRILLPPLAEQRRIVAKIDELFSDIEEGERCLARAEALLKQYRQSVLKAAVTGELTRDWRAQNKGKGETGADLLRRILAARREAWEKSGRSKNYHEPAAASVALLPELPASWAAVSIDAIGQVVTGNTPSTKRPEYYGGDLPFLKPTELDQAYRVSSAREFLTSKGALVARKVPKETVLVTCIGATIGKAGLCRMEAAINQQINAIVNSWNAVDSRYLFWCMTSPLLQHSIVSNASATTLPILNKGRFESLSLPLPPMEEQIEIAERLEAIFDETGDIENDLERRSSAHLRLRQSILRAAFSGSLVPQDPADEPAAALLARIAAERAATTAARGSRARRR